VRTKSLICFDPPSLAHLAYMCQFIFELVCTKDLYPRQLHHFIEVKASLQLPLLWGVMKAGILWLLRLRARFRRNLYPLGKDSKPKLKGRSLRIEP
jgi:hypothetical protein